MANGVRQIAMLLIPSAVIMAVLAEPITRLVYERGEFDAAATDLVSEAMLWWAFSLPFQGISLLLLAHVLLAAEAVDDHGARGGEPGRERDRRRRRSTSRSAWPGS